jgi:hypothetical protein
VALEHLGNAEHALPEPVEDRRRRAIERHLHIDQEPHAQLGRVEPGGVAADEAVALQPAYALEAWRGAETDLARQLDVGNAAVILKGTQNASVDAVEGAAGRCDFRHGLA